MLSALLFATGVNDVSVILSSVHCSLNVDDLTIYVAGVKLPYLERQF